MTILRNQTYGAHARQVADVYYTEGLSRPVVMFVHGGSWATGSKDIYKFIGKTLAKMGFVAVVVNYRLKPEVQFPAYVEDVAAAARWAHEKAASWGGDADQIYIMGHSAGGHIGACAILDPTYLGDPGWLKGFIGLAGGYSVHPGGGDKANAVKLARRTSARFLLLHGRRDLTVHAEVSQELYQSLSAVGTSVELGLYNLGHITLIATFLPIWRKFSPVPRRVKQFILAQ